MYILTEVLMLTLPDGDTHVTYTIVHMYHAYTPTQSTLSPNMLTGM